MWKYQHPDFGLFLLRGLQKQLQGSVFCDTFLQTEGVCIPAHSCVLAALSPVFSRILSTSAPQAGQNRLLSLEAVRYHTLLKLVRFLYTGEIELENHFEREEVVAAALKLGLGHLFDKKRGWTESGIADVGKRWRDADLPKEDHVKDHAESLKTQTRTVSGKDFRKLLEADNEVKNISNEQKQPKLEQFKVKIKLKRSTGSCWKSHLIVCVEGDDEKKLEEAKEGRAQSQSCPATVVPAPSLGKCNRMLDLPLTASDSSTYASSDKCLQDSVSSPQDVPLLSSNPPQTDESDEHIATLLEDMFMMGINILPLMPLDRNLDEQDQLDPLQHQKGVKSCKPEMKESVLSMTATADGSPRQRDEGFQNQSRSNTLELLTQSPTRHHFNNDKNLAPVRDSTPSIVDLLLSPKATAVPHQPSPALEDMPSPVMSSISDARLQILFPQCLSPLESENEGSVVPAQESSKPSDRQDPKTLNLPLRCAESPLMVDFPVGSMIDSSSAQPLRDLNACQNRSSPDLAKKHELKTSFMLDNLTSGSSSNVLQPDVNDASERPKKRKTRKSRFATRRSKTKVSKCQNIDNEHKVQSRIPEFDDNLQPSTSNAQRVSTRLTSANRKEGSGVKRKREISSPRNRKVPLLNTASKQCEKFDDLPQAIVPCVVKNRRGRPRKSKTAPQAHDSALKMPDLGCKETEVEEDKTDNKSEKCQKEEPNPPQENKSTEVKDFNNNFTHKTLNFRSKCAGQMKGPSILNQIFHQTLPKRLESTSCWSSATIDQHPSSNRRGLPFSLQKHQGGKREDMFSKLVMNSSQQINKGTHEERKAEMFVPTYNKKYMEKPENQERLSGGRPGSVKSSANEIQENSGKSTSVLQNSHLQNEKGKEIQDHASEMYVPLASEVDLMKDVMTPIKDMDLNVSTTHDPTVMKEKETDFCMNSQAGNEQRNEETSVASSPNRLSFDVQDSWVSDSLENGEDFGRTKHAQMTEETVESEEPEALRAHEFEEEKASIELDVKGDQYRTEILNERTLLQEEELSRHVASARITDDPSNEDCPQEMSGDAPSVQTVKSNSHSIHVCGEDASTVLSDSKPVVDDNGSHLDEEDIEVDVLEVSVEDPFGLLTAIPITEDILDQEEDLDTSEEEEVDVTGEETE